MRAARRQRAPVAPHGRARQLLAGARAERRHADVARIHPFGELVRGLAAAAALDAGDDHQHLVPRAPAAGRTARSAVPRAAAAPGGRTPLSTSAWPISADSSMRKSLSDAVATRTAAPGKMLPRRRQLVRAQRRLRRGPALQHRRAPRVAVQRRAWARPRPRRRRSARRGRPATARAPRDRRARACAETASRRTPWRSEAVWRRGAPVACCGRGASGSCAPRRAASAGVARAAAVRTRARERPAQAPLRIPKDAKAGRRRERARRQHEAYKALGADRRRGFGACRRCAGARDTRAKRAQRRPPAGLARRAHARRRLRAASRRRARRGRARVRACAPASARPRRSAPSVRRERRPASARDTRAAAACRCASGGSIRDRRRSSDRRRRCPRSAAGTLRRIAASASAVVVLPRELASSARTGCARRARDQALSARRLLSHSIDERHVGGERVRELEQVVDMARLELELQLRRCATCGRRPGARISPTSRPAPPSCCRRNARGIVVRAIVGRRTPAHAVRDAF